MCILPSGNLIITPCSVLYNPVYDRSLISHAKGQWGVLNVEVWRHQKKGNISIKNEDRHQTKLL